MSLLQFWNEAMTNACLANRDREPGVRRAAEAWRRWRFRRWDR